VKGIMMSRYERYGAISKDNGMVILITEEGKPSETICGNCYNA